MKIKSFIILGLQTICLNAVAQSTIYYNCRDIKQRDSISNDLTNKGWKKFNCEKDGLLIVLNSIKTEKNNLFCYKTKVDSNEELSKNEFYSNITEVKKPILDDYLSDTDKFTDEKTYYGGGQIVSFMKVVGKKTSSQYVSIKVNGNTLNYGCYGVSILFENGKKIIRSKEKIKTGYSNKDWEYSAFFSPTLSEISLLKTQKINAVRLYIYDAEINENESSKVLEDAKVLLTTPKVKK